MVVFLARRLGLVLVTFFGITVFAFALIHLIPGDPVMLMFGERNVDPAQLDQLRAQLGLDRPLIVQYGLYVWHAVHGDLGTSLATHDSVMDEFLTHFPATVELAVSAMLIAVLVGVPAGIVAALRRGSTTDYSVMGLCACRLLDADILVGDTADPAVLRHLGIDAGQRAYRHHL